MDSTTAYKPVAQTPTALKSTTIYGYGSCFSGPTHTEIDGHLQLTPKRAFIYASYSRLMAFQRTSKQERSNWMLAQAEYGNQIGTSSTKSLIID
ncbi:6892_t:CDS:2, partial [Acaulospora colombiana]